jgi:hypothetical protein
MTRRGVFGTGELCYKVSWGSGRAVGRCVVRLMRYLYLPIYILCYTARLLVVFRTYVLGDPFLVRRSSLSLRF